MTRALIFESADHDWGDYWDILANGMAFRGPNEDEPLELERSGPFVPPITFPLFELIVNEECKNKLTLSGLSGFEFKKVIKKKLCQLVGMNGIGLLKNLKNILAKGNQKITLMGENTLFKLHQK